MTQSCFERYSSQLTIFDGKVLVSLNLGSGLAAGSITAGLDIEKYWQVQT